jgi:DNA invertase Pin-like site-specific DNA recombinase
MRTALYLRVSTLQQKSDLQADGLRRYAVRAGLEVVAEYRDIAVSGRKEANRVRTLFTSVRNEADRVESS